MLTNYDELNVLSAEQYFGEMELSEKQKQERLEMYDLLMDELDFIFLLLVDYGYFDKNRLVTEVFGAWIEAISNKYDVEQDFVDYAKAFARQFVDDTLKNIDNPTIFSENRKILIAENESNSVVNQEEFNRAIDAGKTEKTWHTLMDGKERDSHRKMNKVSVPINDYFIFKDCEMLFPHDYVNGTQKQLANCRCWLTYK